MDSKNDKSAWLDQCKVFAKELLGDRISDPDDLRDALADAHSLFAGAPLPDRKKYARLKEARLRSATEDHVSACEAAGLHWPGGEFDPDRAHFDLAVTVRSLDVLLRHADASRTLVRRLPELNWTTSDSDHYVIPLFRTQLPDPAAVERMGYDKRGMYHHRVLPRTVEGMPVRLVVARSQENAHDRRENLTSAAGLFPGLEADLDTDADGFLMKSTRLENLEDVLKEQVNSLEGCDFCLWPELTIDDDALDVIVAELGLSALEGRDVPAIVLAGSWHRVDEAGAMRNRMPLLNGSGRPMGWYSKIAIFGDEKVGFERVKEGEELVVVVGDGFLAAVGICKDLSDLQDRNPWVQLPVDVLLIVSMGDEKTMAGHLVRAQELRKGHGRLTFIVQQGLWNHDKDPKNFVLPAPDHVSPDCAATVFEGNFIRGTTGT